MPSFVGDDSREKQKINKAHDEDRHTVAFRMNAYNSDL